jgi:two-component system, chemotaxis family, chemotaxis protein CheY
VTDFNRPILIVDDVPTFRQLMSSLLLTIGYDTIIEAKDGQEAMAILIKFEKMNDPIYAVISDWNMPIVGGLELLKMIRVSGVKDIENVPFLMVTTNNEKENVLEAVEQGADNYLVKPVTLESLELKLKKVLLFKKAIH